MNVWEQRRAELRALGLETVITRLFDLQEQLGYLQAMQAPQAAQGLIPPGDDLRAFRQREGIATSRVATIVRPENCAWILERLEQRFPRLAEMTVVEIGAGVGHLAIAVADRAARVFAIEADPGFSQAFASQLYATKPANLTWIFGTATPEMAAWVPKADLVLVVTGSDEVHLRELGGRFCRLDGVIYLPWQEHNRGQAVVDPRPDFVPFDEEEP